MAKSQELLKQSLQNRMSNYGYFMVEKELIYEDKTVIAYLILPQNLANRADEVAAELLPSAEKEKAVSIKNTDEQESEMVSTSYDQTGIANGTDDLHTPPDELEGEEKKDEEKSGKKTEEKAGKRKK